MFRDKKKYHRGITKYHSVELVSSVSSLKVSCVTVRVLVLFIQLHLLDRVRAGLGWDAVVPDSVVSTLKRLQVFVILA